MSEPRLLRFATGPSFQRQVMTFGMPSGNEVGWLVVVNPTQQSGAGIHIGQECRSAAEVRALIAQIRADLDAAEADALKHFGSN